MALGENIIKLPFKAIRPVYEKTSWHRSVIEEIPDKRLQWAYAHCREITRQFAKTFYLSTRFLPYEKQRSIFAIYALCRYLDNIVDETLEDGSSSHFKTRQVIKEMEDWKKHLHHTYQGFDTDNPILLAFSDVLRAYHIPIELPLELIDGVCMDITKNRYADFDELYNYSYKVASVVGLMTSEIFGYENPEAKKYAVDLGIAMQLTNILRDIGEDLGRDRIYIPLDEMEYYGVTERQLHQGIIDDSFIDLMQFQIHRARGYYKDAANGIPMLNRDSRLPVLLAHHNYSKILTQIEKNSYDVFSQRAHLTFGEKIAVVPRAWMLIDEPASVLHELS